MQHANHPMSPQFAYLEKCAPLPAAARVAIGFAVLATKWHSRRRTRKHLANLPDHLLRDIGIDREKARQEATLPFWRP